MIALWIVIGLVVSTSAVSVLAAAFSVSGLADLFNGATHAVIAMSASLELAKFVLAAYVHQAWRQMHFVMKSYLVTAIVVLSVITSMGIFGFLSNAYQSTSNQLEGETIKINALKGELARINDEIARLNHSVDEIPATRITRKMKARAEVEPAIAQLKAKAEASAQRITEADLKILEVKKKVGPLIYIARAFKIDIDDVVKYLITTFVFVFDPLAICLVLATSQATESRRRAKQLGPLAVGAHTPVVVPVHVGAAAPPPAAPSPSAPAPEVTANANPTAPAVQAPESAVSAGAPAPAADANDPETGEVIQMRIVEDKDAV